MNEEKVYLGLGANLGDPLKTLQETVFRLRALPGVSDVKVSRFYQTSPVSDIPQNDYINAVCCLKTTHDPEALHRLLRDLEDSFGEKPSIKNAPRHLDIDILLFGRRVIYDEKGLRVPHPRWMERLFVLAPFLDLTSKVDVPNVDVPEEVVTIDLREYLETFSNPHNETVKPVTGEMDE